MGRGSNELDAAAADYVAVKITNMKDVDVANVRFDFDLTFAVVLMHADGTIYHRYGGRAPDSATSYLSLTSLAALLRDTLPEHRAYDDAPKPPLALPAQRAIDLPFLKQKLAAGQQIDCVHCHTVNDAEHAELVRTKQWQHDDLYLFPDPERIGFTLDRERQRRITAVAADSPAAKAGIEVGDELLSLGTQRSVRTYSDVQWALQQAAPTATQLPIRFCRDGDDHAATLVLPANWKHCDPRDYAWRPYKWNLSPAAGFGGPTLTPEQRSKAGLGTAPFALRVQYIADFGDRAHRGKAARAAGLQNGDLVIAFAGKRDFADTPHFQAWVSMTQTAGADTEIVVWRDGKAVTLHYALPE